MSAAGARRYRVPAVLLHCDVRHIALRQIIVHSLVPFAWGRIHQQGHWVRHLGLAGDIRSLNREFLRATIMQVLCVVKQRFCFDLLVLLQIDARTILQRGSVRHSVKTHLEIIQVLGLALSLVLLKLREVSIR